MTDPTLIAVPLFFASMGIEAYVLFRRGRGYEGKDTVASLSGGVGNLVVSVLLQGAMLALWELLYAHRLLSIGAGALAWLTLIFAEDFVYYWYHRLSHELRFLWAMHVAHHSSERYTLATALRQSWTAPFVILVFWAPLPLVGFRPEMVLLMHSFSLLYQYWIHTETIGSLGPLEWLFNTPSHHRVHHGSNPRYIDKNHAGIFIIWDRLFGTFEPEGEPVRYGLTKPVGTFNPVRIQTHELVDIARDVLHAGNLRSAVIALTRMPRPHG